MTTTPTTTPTTPTTTPTTTSAPLAILVLQRGWVAIGRHTITSDGTHVLTASKVIRRWGTSHGLGQLALTGPTSDTRLDDSGTLTAAAGSVILALDVVEGNWAAQYPQSA